ncbi:HNH endonuclease signature motif containing protein [Pseudomonas sp. S3_E11]
MFFPKLIRRKEEEYYSNRNNFYADYRDNYKKIAEDCLNRCVYCDITTDEYGGDEMHLDHFRPQEHFDELSTHPYNLYLSCPKCNGLKTSDWPCPKKLGAPSFIGRIGYLDRFTHDPVIYLKVSQDGLIIPIAGPTDYMIKKMHLNRPSRVNIRRKRIIESKKTVLLNGILRLTSNLEDAVAAGRLTSEQLTERHKKISSLLISYSTL